MNLPESLKNCPCGRKHEKIYTEVVSGKGVLEKIPEYVMRFGGKKAFVTADRNTYEAAGKKVAEILEKAHVPYVLFVFSKDAVKPDEETVGNLFMHFDDSCDIIIGVGSGVINDSCKLLSKRTGRKYILAATAPSMDGFVSATSSMEVDGLKVSLNTRAADAVIGDTQVLKNAPSRMLASGLGDILAKYISICEWRISNLINGEYYCENVAALVRASVKKCVDNMEGLMKRDDAAVEAVFDALALSGAAMNYAGASRPASGSEHYFSHIWDMRALEFGTPCDFHGIQCAIGTFYAAGLYEELVKITPESSKAQETVEKFDYEKYSEHLKKFLGKASEPIIALEEKERKYDTETIANRRKKIIEKWPEILKIISEEVPKQERIKEILEYVKAPVRAEEIGIDRNILKDTFLATKDIRDKYVLARLVFDLGIAEEFGEMTEKM